MDKSLLEYLSIAIGAAIGFMFGDLNGMFCALLALCILDYVSGVMVAIKLKELSSRVGYIGIMKKVLIFILVSVGHLIDVHIVKGGNVFMSACTLYYACNEGISICENAESIGIPLPKKLLKILKQVRDENDEEN